MSTPTRFTAFSILRRPRLDMQKNRYGKSYRTDFFNSFLF